MRLHCLDMDAPVGQYDGYQVIIAPIRCDRLNKETSGLAFLDARLHFTGKTRGLTLERQIGPISSSHCNFIAE